MSIMRSVNMKELSELMIEISDALKPINVKVISSYEAIVQQRLGNAEVRGVKVELRFCKDDES